MRERERDRDYYEKSSKKPSSSFHLETTISISNYPEIVFSVIRNLAGLKQNSMEVGTEWLYSLLENGKMVLRYEHSL